MPPLTPLSAVAPKAPQKSGSASDGARLLLRRAEGEELLRRTISAPDICR